MIRERLVHLVDPDVGIAVQLRDPLAAARFPLAGVYPFPEALLAAEHIAPDVVVLDCAATGGQPAPIVRAIASRWPDACVVVTGGTPSMLSHAVAAGARAFLLKPYVPEELVSVMAEAMAGSLTAPQAVSPSGKILAVWGPKGGVGRSTVAVAVSVLLAGRGALSVGLVDLDLQFGDVGVLLDVRTPNSIADLVGHEIDATVVDDTFMKHESGLRVLPAPDGLAVGGPRDPQAIVRALDGLRPRFDVIVLDLPASLDELTARSLREADCVVLVTKPELTALKSLCRVLNARELKLQLDDHALIVVNRLPSRGSLTDAEIERSLGRPIAVRIPSDGAAIVDAANRGIPIGDPRVHSRANKAFLDLTAAIARELELGPRPVTRLVEVA